ncbi:hypothetical protein BJ170DRAFT_598762 [Xylariales sp. AK1849]|nr:hypothetical protein BJ170DRAFT_598762 [Xylariales sp. AK1849]
MSVTNIGAGWNPASGWDTGSLPPGASNTSIGGGGYLPAYSPAPSTAYYGFPLGGLAGGYSYPAATYSVPIPGPPFSQGPVYTMPTNGHQVPLPVFPGHPRYPTAHPVVNAECPAMNLQNSTGGAGCEPGYNYYFAAEHTKIHIIKSRDPPWQQPPGVILSFSAYHVPALTTLGDLMKGFGATNPTAKKNKITELNQGSNGKWYKGITLCADDKDDMKKNCKDLGWDMTRTGRHGEKPVVWLWVTKD